MLLRIVWLFGLGLCLMGSGLSEEKQQPHVFVLISDEPAQIEDESLPAYYWSVPGRLPNLAAFLYGKTPLECGVVSDFDWRRKPVPATSLADVFQKAGYHTAFVGDWGMGATSPYDPRSRGFQSIWVSASGRKVTLEDRVNIGMGIGGQTHRELEQMVKAMPQDQPWFCVVRGSCNHETGKKWLNTLVSKAASKRGGVVVLLNLSHMEILPTLDFSGSLPQLYPVSIWELSSNLMQWVSGGVVQKQPYFYYHTGGWPLTDSPEKHRFRGGIVMGKKLALADGLSLYRMIQDQLLSPDKKHPLDLTTHALDHQRLLKAYGQWWKLASQAIQNPRPMNVGEKDLEVVTLTALDWRPSKILHKDGSAIASQPMVYYERLIGTLRGIRDNEAYKQSFPAYSGSWSINVTRAGRYKITARLLPKAGVAKENQPLAKLQGGQAHVKLGRNEVELQLIKGATSVSVLTDADAGPTDLECWFVGQLSLDRELGAFFVEIERVGDKKFDLNLKTNPSEE